MLDALRAWGEVLLFPATGVSGDRVLGVCRVVHGDFDFEGAIVTRSDSGLEVRSNNKEETMKVRELLPEVQAEIDVEQREIAKAVLREKYEELETAKRIERELAGEYVKLLDADVATIANANS